MKTILKKLIAHRATLTKFIFVALFFTMVTAVPVHRAEAYSWDDLVDDFQESWETVVDAWEDFTGGGDDGGGDSRIVIGSGVSISTQYYSTGYGSSIAAHNLGQAAADWHFTQTGERLYVETGYDGNGGYHYRLVSLNDNDDNDGDPNDPYVGTVYGEIGFWGANYAGKPTNANPYGVECQDGIQSWSPACNSSCTALDGFSCDTRDPSEPVKIDIYENGVLYDTIEPTLGTTAAIRYYCGGSSNEDNQQFRYVTPPAWKDDVTRTITIKARRLSDGLTKSLVNAPWSGPQSFPVTCPFEPPVIDLTGTLGTVSNQTKDVPFDIDTIIKNIGTLAVNSSIEVDLRFDFGTDGWHNGTNGDFSVRRTVNALGAGAQVDHTFSDITIPKIGNWKVQLVVDPRYQVESGSSVYQSNNKTPWKDFAVDNPLSTTPALYLSANPNRVQVGGDTTLLWVGEKIEPGTCIASGAWSGSKANSGYETVLVGNVVGTKLYRLSCTGTDSTTISRTASVNVTNDTPTTDITINFWAAPSIIRSGERTRLYYDITTHYDATCSVTGPGGRSDPFHIIMNPDAPDDPVTLSGDFPTAPITNNQRFTITCTPDDLNNGPAVTKSVSVEVIPIAQEV